MNVKSLAGATSAALMNQGLAGPITTPGTISVLATNPRARLRPAPAVPQVRAARRPPVPVAPLLARVARRLQVPVAPLLVPVALHPQVLAVHLQAPAALRAAPTVNRHGRAMSSIPAARR